MKKLEPKCLPVWVKMVNVPLEAWTVEGISAIASRLGKPMMMDTITSTMCHKRIGNFEFARVLVEMDAQKEFKKEILIQYRDRNNNAKGNKTVKVIYDWKPPACVHCKVFGHDARQYKKEEHVKEEKMILKQLKSIMRERRIRIVENIRKMERRCIRRTNQTLVMEVMLIDSKSTSNGSNADRFQGNRRHEYRKRQVDADNLNKEGDGSKPWCIAGDMNVILHPNEHSCGSSIMNPDMMEFQDCLNAIEVEDICSSGLHFTWTKNLHKVKMGNMTGVLKKLNRIMSIKDFIKNFPQAHAKLKEAKLVEEFFEAESDEEKFLQQQAKIKWLCEGEKNNNYFHRVLKGRRNKSKVFSLCDDNGISSDQEQIPQFFLKHFKKFFSSTYPVQDIKSSETLVKKKLSFADDDKMIADVSNAKIKRALFDIDDSKSPGPDGFTAAFFKQVWRIAGVDICNAVKEFFSSGKMLGELNANLVSLILKIQTPNKVTDFKPIADNVLYKCISKVLINRLKTSLGNLVSCNQSAFIPGRHIQDNILLTQKIIRGYNRKGGPKRMAFKIDIQKAYDTVNWDFLKKVLEGFGYHEKMVNWVMQYVTTAAFTLNVNGDRIG
ncbi:RNA-directed DNA polymerase, eukaryota, reverse transcriptase zinc-binding domain protein [Tanacetum coccineum]